MRICLASLLGLLGTNVVAADSWNMTEGVTAVSRDVYWLHMLVFWVCVVIGVIVFAMMLWTIYFHRKSRHAEPAKFTHNTTAEIIWTVIPVIIVVALAVPAGTTLTAMYDTSEADVNIKITGHQWKWEYQYLEDDIHFFSHLATPRSQIYNQSLKGENYLLEVDNRLVVPTGQKVRFLTTSNDVLHSWWVPDLAIKRDAIPGFVNESWAVIEEPGVYRGQCAELCGTDHAFMPIVLEALDPEDYQAWVAENAAAQPELDLAAAEVDPGEAVYQQYCAACHQAGGAGLPPAFPSLHGSAVLIAADPSEIIGQVLMGKGAMPAFAAQLDDEQIAQVLTYTRSAWGNTANPVTAAQVGAVRN